MSSRFSQIPKKEKDKLRRTIKLLSKILADLKIEYRIFGSIIPAALLGRPQRKLGDIDLMVETEDKKIFYRELEKIGYQIKENRFTLLGFDFLWVEAISKDLLTLTIFLGKFDENQNFISKISKNISAIAHGESIKPTHYSFYGAKFTGVPAMTAYYGALTSKGNPKRKYDLAVFENQKIQNPPKGFSIIDFYYKKTKLPFLYSLGCFLQDFLGRISIALGGNYDFWRK
jgi:hypothetical protein